MRAVVDLSRRFRGPRIQGLAIPADPRSILFVCKGTSVAAILGISRVEIALKEYEFRHQVWIGGLVSSENTNLSPENTIRIARQFGVDLMSHRSQSISQELVKSYDMVIAMKAWQCTALRVSF